MKKVKTIVLDLTLALGLLAATGFATGILPVNGEGAEIFGGAATGACANFYVNTYFCSGTASGCVYTACFGGGSNKVYISSYYAAPCGVYACNGIYQLVGCVQSVGSN
jgi:hypothetical protein